MTVTHDSKNNICQHCSALAKLLIIIIALIPWPSLTAHVNANEFLEPWKDKSRAIVLDAYEKNPIDWHLVAQNRQIAGFVAKASDGMPPPWRCLTIDETEFTLCKKTFQNHWLKKQLYHSRKMIAKSIGLKWGAYHLGRPGNPIEQANHFIDFTDPEDDDLLALDIEHDDPENWISFPEAEAFVKHVKFRTGRYPVLYTNHVTAKRIAARRAEFPVLSRLPIWYARYRGDIRGAFPMGHWRSFAMWQFSSGINCNNRRCLYRVKGTNHDIDVNVTNMSVEELRRAWPFGGLVPERKDIPEYETKSLVAEVKREKKPSSQAIVRFKSDLTFLNERGKRIKLSNIAIPTRRNHALGNSAQALNDEKQKTEVIGVEVADLENSFYANTGAAEISSIGINDNPASRHRSAYGYTNNKKSSKYGLRH